MRKWMPVLAATLLAVTLVSLSAQQTGKAAKLSALDTYEIQQLYARFCHALDSASANGYLFADVFTADGVYVDRGGKSYTGRDHLAELARENPGERKSPTNLIHFTTNVMITAAKDGARGQAYVLVATASPQGGGLSTAGVYQDDLVKTAQGWRIKRRRFATAPIAPEVLPPAGAALRRSPSSALTAQDYAEIAQLYPRYAYALDSAADHGAALAALFTADGALTDESEKTHKGRTQLMAAARGGGTNGVATAQHFVWNVKIDPSETGATGKAYTEVLKLTQEGQPAAVSDLGQYWDDLVKTPEGWRIKNRVFHKAPASATPAGVIESSQSGASSAGPVATPSAVGSNEGSRAEQAQQTRGGLLVKLSAADYAEILQLYARYPYAFDGGTDQGKASAALYTSDGIFGDARTGKLLQGSEALAANSRGPNKNPLTTAHILTNIMLTPTSGGVVGEAYRISNAGVPVGIYFSLFVKTTQGWRIKETHFTGPNFPVPENARHFLQETAKETPSG